MPKTKTQELVFSILMVVIMVYFMTVYNLAIMKGLSYLIFLQAFLGMWVEVIAAFLAQKFIAGPISKKLAFQIFKPGVDKPVFITVAISCFTVSIMAPIMTLFVTLLHNGFVIDLPLLWLPKLIQNFLYALCIQLFYVGPLVRLIFRTIFRKQLQISTIPVQISKA